MKKQPNTSAPENAFARKALESLREIEEEAARKKTEQLEGLREVLGNIDGRIQELQGKKEQVQDAIGRITGKAPLERRRRTNHDELRARVLRWLLGHAGTWYHANDLQREFPELQEMASVSTLLKSAIGEGAVKVDKTGGNRNTKYSAAS